MNTLTKTRLPAFGAMAVITTVTITAPNPAHADISVIADHLVSQFDSIANLIGALAFVLGLGLGASGLMKFRQHSDNPNAVPISQPLVRLVIAAMLIALPAVLGTGITTFFEEGAQTTNVRGEIGDLEVR